MEYLAALPPREITDRLLTETEGQWFDRKSARISGRDLAETLVAMANAEGGVIAIGLHDGVCEGVDARPSAQNTWRQAGIDFTVPPVRYAVQMLPCIKQHGDADRLFVIQIPPSAQVHSTNRDVAFLRVGDENRRLTFDQRLELRYDKGDTSYETTPSGGSNFMGLDEGALSEFAVKVGHPESTTANAGARTPG